MPRNAAAPSQTTLNAMNFVHRGLIRLTRGRVGWHIGGMPVLELTTIGRTSGEPRSAMLSSPMQPGGSYIVVASRGGDDKHPAWYLNLVANPEVEVDYRGGGRQKRIARVATAAERAELWPKVTADYGFYAAYQKRTDREIPLVFLDPVASPS